ncbi:MAG: hypothetical protein P1V97_23395 [Planctomycetota bacterium]|nr:hypothetical protein [Planctomycetota bacterium]
MAKRAVNLLFYAINGTGLGHLSRLLNIARAADSLLQLLDIPCQIQFLTTSEGSEIAGQYPVYKIPSKTVIHKKALSRSSYGAQAKLLISNVVAGIKPDILILDTVPEGSFKEFLFLKDYAKRTAFVYRHMLEERQLSETVQAHLSLYDLIMIPDDSENKGRYFWPKKKKDAIQFVGCIHGYRGDSLQSVGFPNTELTTLNRRKIRDYFSVTDDKTLIYVSAGGGGDERAAGDIKTIIDTLSEDPKHVLLVGYGPLYQGAKVYRSNVIPLSEPGVSRYFPGLDLAVSAAGYNTYSELLAAGVPSLFYAQEKGWDDQRERVNNGHELGWHERLTTIDPLLLQSKVAALKDPEKRSQLRTALEARSGQSGAANAAKALLELHSGISGSSVLRRELSFVRELLSLTNPVDEAQFQDSYRCGRCYSELIMSRSKQDDFVDQSRFHPGEEWREQAGLLVRRGELIHGWIRYLDWRLEEWIRLAKAVFHGTENLSSNEIGAQLEEAFESLTSSVPGPLLSEFLRQSRRCLAKDQMLEFLRWILDEIEEAEVAKVTQAVVDYCSGYDAEKMQSAELLSKLDIHEREAR